MECKVIDYKPYKIFLMSGFFFKLAFYLIYTLFLHITTYMLQVNCLLRAWFSISIANPPTTTNQIKLTNVGKIYAISMIFLIVRPLLIRVANIAMSGAHPNHHPPGNKR